MTTKIEYEAKAQELDALKEKNAIRIGEINKELKRLQVELGALRMRGQSTARIHTEIRALENERKEIQSEKDAISQAIQEIRDELIACRVAEAKEEYIQASAIVSKKSNDVFDTVARLIDVLIDYHAASRAKARAGAVIKPYGLEPAVDPELPINAHELAAGILPFLPRFNSLPKNGAPMKDRVSKMESKLGTGIR